jgi:hypothetical protein
MGEQCDQQARPRSHFCETKQPEKSNDAADATVESGHIGERSIFLDVTYSLDRRANDDAFYGCEFAMVASLRARCSSIRIAIALDLLFFPQESNLIVVLRWDDTTVARS